MSKITGGSAFGIGDAVIDARKAVLLDTVAVAVVGTASLEHGAGHALAINLEGRRNKSDERVDVLYLTDPEGCAAIVSEILGLADRVGPDFRNALLARIAALPKRHPA